MELEKRIIEDERIRALEEMSSINQHSMVIFPKYKVDAQYNVDREYDKPAEELYIPLGWDVDSTTKRKHYRHYITGELENHKEIFEKPSPFDVYNL